MAELMDFRNPSHQTIESALHAPPPDREAYVEDLDASQIHHLPHPIRSAPASSNSFIQQGTLRPRASRTRQSSDLHHHANTRPMAQGTSVVTASNMDGINGEVNSGPARISLVGSGKVYKQLFDAGVQLNQAYDKVKNKQNQSGGPNIKSRFGGIPIVHSKRNMKTEGTGILNERQQQWVSAFPYENSIENPVMYRQAQELEESLDEDLESENHSKEVRDLPDEVTPKKEETGVVEKIYKCREKRHEAAIDELHQELLLAASEMEPQIERVGTALITKLSENDAEIEQITLRYSNPWELMKTKQAELRDLWALVQEQTTRRQTWIKSTMSTLNQIEDRRTQKVVAVLSKYTKVLHKIAFLNKSDLDKIIDKEVQLLNKTILSNRRNYSELALKLISADVEREKKMHDVFSMQNEEWKQQKVVDELKNFEAFLSDPEVVSPPAIDKILSHLSSEHEKLNGQRKSLLDSLNDFRPPNATKKAVLTWYEQLKRLNVALNELNVNYMQRIFAAYEKICETCAQVATDLRGRLVAMEACSIEEADKILNEKIIPLIGDRQKVYEQHMEKMDKEIERQAAKIEEEMEHLFQFCQGAAHIWDIHEVGLAQTERALQEKLLIARRDHDLENQDRENHLDVVMDKMRQDSNESNLGKNLKKVNEALEQIHTMYEKFHKDQAEVIKTYPHMVKEELEDFDLAVKTYFAVDIEMPVDVQSRPKSGTPKTSRDGTTHAALNQEKNELLPNRYQLTDLATYPLPGELGEVIVTKKGTKFYILSVQPATKVDNPPETTAAGNQSNEGTADLDNSTSAPETGRTEDSNASTFLTEISSDRQEKTRPVRPEPIFLTGFQITSNYFTELKKIIRLNFLEQMEEWTEEALQRGFGVVSAKDEELASELELRLHLHAPRSRRAELDVHNVRAAELVMHNERVMRHCKGINQSLSELRVKFDTLLTEHNQRFDTFNNNVERMEEVVLRANKSSMLVEQQAAVVNEKDSFMTDIRQSLRTFRKNLDSNLQMMRESNAMFIKSFKLFSDGGNFCPEEIDGFRKSLDKYSHKIDDAEGIVMSELEGIESKWLKRATQLAMDFEDRFKNQMTDLVFIERVARWLTNTQVKVKAEVADSNAQAKRLAQHLNDLERRIDACEKPNLDKEVVSSNDLKDSLLPMFEYFHDRSEYIACRLPEEPVDNSEDLTKATDSKSSIKVGFTESAPSQQGTVIVPKSKHPTEDPTIALVKNIYRTQKSQMSPFEEAHAPMRDRERKVETIIEEKDADRPTTDNKSVPSVRVKTKGKSKQSSKPSRSNTRQGSGSNEPPKNRHSSAARRIARFDRRDKRFQLFSDEPLVDTEYFDSVFTDFVGRVKRVLREAHEGLISSSEVFYKNKGTHPITRTYALQPTMEQCAETVTTKLQSYYKQASDYHNSCLQEFRQQLYRMEKLVERIPPLIAQDILEECERNYIDERNRAENTFKHNMKYLDAKRDEHKTLLRPTLGHPNHASKMSDLCKDESQRSMKAVTEILEFEVKLKQLTEKHAQLYIEKISVASTELLSIFDNMLTIDDVLKGRVIPNKYPTNELLRRQRAGEPLEDKIPDTLMYRGATDWLGLPLTEMIAIAPQTTQPMTAKERRLAEKQKQPRVTHTAKMHSVKTTMGHNSSIDTRDKFYQNFKNKFERRIKNIETEREEMELSEKRWTVSWQESINKIKSLF